MFGRYGGSFSRGEFADFLSRDREIERWRDGEMERWALRMIEGMYFYPLGW